jgi:hypothetical protein
MTRLAAALLAAAAMAATAAAAPIASRVGEKGLSAYPDAQAACGALPNKKFLTCRPQIEVLQAALAQARAEDKAVLIEVGADWCASCHVLDRYFNGWFGTEPRAAGTAADAQALARFMATNFVLARLEVDQPSLHPALRSVGLRKDISKGLPAFYVLYGGKTREVRVLDAAVRVPGGRGGFSRQALLAQFRRGLAVVRPAR